MLVPLVRSVIVAAASGFLLSEPPLTSLTVPLSATAWGAGPQKQFAGAGSQLDINSAWVDQLRTRLKINETYARRIVQGRPYHRVEGLAGKKIIPRAIYEKIEDRIAVGQEK
jgi:competence protein ComEA